MVAVQRPVSGVMCTGSVAAGGVVCIGSVDVVGVMHIRAVMAARVMDVGAVVACIMSTTSGFCFLHPDKNQFFPAAGSVHTYKVLFCLISIMLRLESSGYC